MTFLREGYGPMALTGALAVGTLATSVWRRSWMLWLAGFALLVLAAVVAWSYRAPAVSDVAVARVVR